MARIVLFYPLGNKSEKHSRKAEMLSKKEKEDTCQNSTHGV
jgi:hypothetical protein